MRIVITGGAGFLGSLLARRILERGALVDVEGRSREIRAVTLVDLVPAHAADARVASVSGDLADPAFVERAIADDTDSVFHFAAVVSGEAEADFDRGMRVNVDATRILLERCRKLARTPKLVFASSLAVFGAGVREPVGDDAPVMPQTSYGAQKAIGELLVNDMSRKGFVDGRSLRLPTVTVRPGKPNRAASSFASGIIREPLAGVTAVCPVADTTRMWVTSPQAVIENIVVAHDAPASAFTGTRSLNVPGLSVSMREMADALRAVAGDAVAERIEWRIDPVVDRIVRSWPARFAPERGLALGMRGDTSFEAIVAAYRASDGSRRA